MDGRLDNGRTKNLAQRPEDDVASPCRAGYCTFTSQMSDSVSLCE